MALGTMTNVGEAGKSPSDPTPWIRLTFAADNAYPIGGYAGFSGLVSTKLGRGFTVFDAHGFADKSGTSYHVEYDLANDKLKIRAGATGIELADLTDLTGVTVSVTVVGK